MDYQNKQKNRLGERQTPNRETQTPRDFQPILTKLEYKRKPKWPLIIIAAIAVIAGVILVVHALDTNNESKVDSNTTSMNVASQSSESEIQTTEDKYAFIYETTTQEAQEAMDEHGNLTEEAAFPPEELAKVENFFGPLPESDKKSTFEHKKIRGIYVYDVNALDQYFAEIEGTEVNTVILDVKESWGLLYDSKLPLATELDAIIEHRDIKSIFERCHEKGLRVIARIVCFKDSTMAEKRPDLTIANESGTPIQFSLEGGNTFASPYNQDVWQYLIDIAAEVIELGADEIQFDYIRFPSGGSVDGSAAYFGNPEEVPEKFSAINRFLQTAVIEIQDKLNVPIGADLFSIIMTSEVDGLAIGQNWQRIGLTGINNICPMIYPSHYANASTGSLGNGVGSYIGNGFYEAPDLHAYDVVKDAFVDGMPAIEQKGYAHIRPYLQAFTASYLSPGYYQEYLGPQIREQIQATYDAGFDEWILWNVQTSYPAGTFLPAEQSGLNEN